MNKTLLHQISFFSRSIKFQGNCQIKVTSQKAIDSMIQLASLTVMDYPMGTQGILNKRGTDFTEFRTREALTLEVLLNYNFKGLLWQLKETLCFRRTFRNQQPNYFILWIINLKVNIVSLSFKLINSHNFFIFL